MSARDYPPAHTAEQWAIALRARWLASDLGAAPPGHRWAWSDLGRKWVLVADRAATPAASPPVRQSDLGPFEMPVANIRRQG